MRKYALYFVILLFFPFQTYAKDLSPVLDVIFRVAPWMEGKVIVEGLAVEDENCVDAYELSMVNGRLLIKATSIPAAGMGFNHYLKYYCHRNYALVGQNMEPVDTLPPVVGIISHSTSAKYRHFFNFCTLNYSASFWEWPDWQRVIDYMVLNGVNLTLATVGMEKIWYNTLSKMNFSEKEILDFLPGPAYNAWHMLGNMEGWGGPITRQMIDKRANLARKIITTLREYDISPIYMSFYGMVPRVLKDKYPKARIIPQGKWAGGFDRSSILYPLDSLYDRIADIYYREIADNYGRFDYFAGEPFHEGGIRDGIDISELSHAVLDKCRTYNPGAKWVLQAWGDNPSSEFLKSLSKENDVLICDFKGELTAEWERRKGYEGYPFLWGVANNFGETPGLYGRLQRFVDEYFRAEDSPYSVSMQGLGVSPEGILNNPVNFELLFEIPWHQNRFSIEEWLDDYVFYRYGQDNQPMKNVWSVLSHTAYSSRTDSVNIEPASKVLPSIAGNPESIICAPPALNISSASSWGTSFVFYDMDKMKKLIPHLLEAVTSLSEVDAFRYDLIDITRQLLSNEFKIQYVNYQKAVSERDKRQMDVYSTRMLSLMDDMELLLSTRKEFMVGSWIESAKKFGISAYEKELSEWNARSIVSYWGPDCPETDLRDYAHKEWAGLIKDLYKPRWIKFFEAVSNNGIVDEKAESLSSTQQSIEWSRKRNYYESQPTADEVSISVELLRKLMNKEY